MGEMMFHITRWGAVFVSCDSLGQPVLSQVPNDLMKELQGLEWKRYAVSTKTDQEIYSEVQLKGYSLRNKSYKFTECEGAL